MQYENVVESVFSVSVLNVPYRPMQSENAPLSPILFKTDKIVQLFTKI